MRNWEASEGGQSVMKVTYCSISCMEEFGKRNNHNSTERFNNWCSKTKRDHNRTILCCLHVLINNMFFYSLTMVTENKFLHLGSSRWKNSVEQTNVCARVYVGVWMFMVMCDIWAMDYAHERTEISRCISPTGESSRKHRCCALEHYSLKCREEEKMASRNFTGQLFLSRRPFRPGSCAARLDTIVTRSCLPVIERHTQDPLDRQGALLALQDTQTRWRGEGRFAEESSP